MTSTTQQLLQQFVQNILSGTIIRTIFFSDESIVSNTNNGLKFYFNTTNVAIDMQPLPPAPITWIYNTIDLLWYLLSLVVSRFTSSSNTNMNTSNNNNNNWRQYITFITNQSTLLQRWLSEEFIIPDLFEYRPKLLSFAQFVTNTGTSSTQQEPSQEAFSLGKYIQTFVQYAFYTESTQLGDLTTPIAIITTLLMVVLIRQIKAFLLPRFSSIGKQMATSTHGVIWVQENSIRIQKFGEYVFRLCFHSGISIYGIIAFIMQQEIWWQGQASTIYVFKGYPHHPISSKMAWYYIIQCAYNIDALITLLAMSFTISIRSITTKSNNKSKTKNRPYQFPITIQWSDTVRGDFQEMFIHHIVTNALVIGSSMLRLTRIGSMVFLIHDISDVPVDLSKLANFLKWTKITIFCFMTMAITWFYTRLYLLPFYIYATALTKSHYVLESGSVPVLLYVCYRHFFYIFLGLLILLHTAWFMMFIRMFITLIFKKECHDLSEHKQGEPPPTAVTTNDNTNIKTKKQL